jgi:hypothetical protein
MTIALPTRQNTPQLDTGNAAPIRKPDPSRTALPQGKLPGDGEQADDRDAIDKKKMGLPGDDPFSPDKPRSPAPRVH